MLGISGSWLGEGRGGSGETWRQGQRLQLARWAMPQGRCEGKKLARGRTANPRASASWAAWELEERYTQSPIAQSLSFEDASNGASAGVIQAPPPRARIRDFRELRVDDDAR